MFHSGRRLGRYARSEKADTSLLEDRVQEVAFHSSLHPRLTPTSSDRFNVVHIVLILLKFNNYICTTSCEPLPVILTSDERIQAMEKGSKQPSWRVHESICLRATARPGRSASAGERRGQERAQSRPIGVDRCPWCDPPELTEKSPGEAPLNWHGSAALSPARALGPVNRGFRTPQRVVSRPKTGSRDDLAHGEAINAAWNSMSLATASLVVLTFNS